jgi:hypothetical protein
MQVKNVNPSKFFDTLMKNELPPDIEAYLKLTKYKIKRKKRKSSQDLETLLGNCLSQLALQLVMHKERKLIIFLILKFLFGKKSKLDAQISKMFFCLSHKLEVSYPFELWDPKFFELMNLKKEYQWNYYILTSSDIQKEISMVKSKQSIQFQMTNQVTRGNTQNKIRIEGANTKDGVNITFYCDKKGKLEIEKELFICPMFVISSDVPKEKINRSISLSEKLFANVYKSRSF